MGFSFVHVKVDVSAANKSIALTSTNKAERAVTRRICGLRLPGNIANFSLMKKPTIVPDPGQCPAPLHAQEERGWRRRGFSKENR
jgi:hypothetical protein